MYAYTQSKWNQNREKAFSSMSDQLLFKNIFQNVD